MTTLEEAAKREIAKMNQVMQTLKLVDEKQNDKQAVELKKLVDAYYGDSAHFLHTEKFLEAFEAAVICWAYVDSGLHLGIFEVKEEFKKYFTL